MPNAKADDISETSARGGDVCDECIDQRMTVCIRLIRSYALQLAGCGLDCPAICDGFCFVAIGLGSFPMSRQPYARVSGYRTWFVVVAR